MTWGVGAGSIEGKQPGFGKLELGWDKVFIDLDQGEVPLYLIICYKVSFGTARLPPF